MEDLKRKQKIRRALYSLPSLLALCLVAILLVKGGIGVIRKQLESAESLQGLEEKAAALVLREEELKKDIARLETDEGKREEIRERFSVIQEGEYVAVIVEGKAPTSSESDLSKPWYRRFWSAIMGE